jgi:hypothetical protein
MRIINYGATEPKTRLVHVNECMLFWKAQGKTSNAQLSPFLSFLRELPCGHPLCVELHAPKICMLNS